jgi:hypothetical protein
MADIKFSQLLASSPATVAAAAALLTHKGHILGLGLEWVSATSIRATTGSAWIESLGYAVAVNSAITKSSLSLSANTWYHVYLFMSGSTADIEVVTTAPATAYSGTALSKTGDNTRRYLGSVRTDGSGNVIKFTMQRGMVTYQLDTTSAPNRVLSGGTATTWTSIDCSAVAPVTAGAVVAMAQNASASVTVQISQSAAGADFGMTVGTSQAFVAQLPLGASQTLHYQAAGAITGGLTVDVWGYTFER